MSYLHPVSNRVYEIVLMMGKYGHMMGCACGLHRSFTAKICCVGELRLSPGRSTHIPVTERKKYTKGFAHGEYFFIVQLIVFL